MVEGPTQDGRELGEFPSMLAERAPAHDQLVDRVLGAVDLRLAPPQPPGLLEVPRFPRQLGQAFEGRGLEGLELDQAGHSRRWACRSPPRSASQTRRAAIASGGADSAGIRPAASQNRASSSVAIARSRRASPDRGIVRTAAQAPLQQPLGIGGPADQDRVPGPTQPDPIIVGIGRVEEDLPCRRPARARCRSARGPGAARPGRGRRPRRR